MTQIIESSPAICSIIWDVTNKCNLCCRHCYNADKYFQDNRIPELTRNEAIQAIDMK